jgi:hypothetical protein
VGQAWNVLLAYRPPTSTIPPGLLLLLLLMTGWAQEVADEDLAWLLVVVWLVAWCIDWITQSCTARSKLRPTARVKSRVRSRRRYYVRFSKRHAGRKFVSATIRTKGRVPSIIRTRRALLSPRTSEERIRDLNRVTQAVLIRKSNHVLDQVVQYLQSARARFREVSYYRPYCVRLWRHFGPARCDDCPPYDPPDEDERSSPKDEFYCCALASKSKVNHMPPFDSDSFTIAIDNCASECFTNDVADFISKERITGTVRGIGQQQVKWKGTVRWRILDDQGRRHTFTIRNVVLNTDLPFRLIAPHVLAQQRGDEEGTGCITLGRYVELFWEQRQFTRRVPFDSSNIATLQSAPGYKQYKAFAGTLEEPTTQINYVTDDEEDDDASDDATVDELPDLVPQTQQEGLTSAPEEEGALQEEAARSDTVREGPLMVEFGDTDLNEEAAAIPPEDVSAQQYLLLKTHLRLGHMPMPRLKAMAKKGLLPSCFVNTPMPMCASCAYGKATRRPTRTKGQSRQARRMVKITKPGDCVSVDQLESPTPGFIGQMKGILTTKRYTTATIFVDHRSRMGFVYLQQSTNAEETLNAKIAFETYARSHGVQVRHYHADNGRFAENAWLAHVEESRQSITFCGVGAHFQNGIAEKRIRDLQESARTMMLRASDKWQVAQSTSLWPYALRLANEALNCTPRSDHNVQSPVELFTSSKVRPNLKNLHHIGTPAFVLKHNLQAAGGYNKKWNSRARLGIYLGPSPSHSRGVSLILNPRTGLVSPQWHVKHDDMFDTVAGNTVDPTHGQWKKLAGLTDVPETQARDTNPAKTRKSNDKATRQLGTPTGQQPHTVPEPIQEEVGDQSDNDYDDAIPGLHEPEAGNVEAGQGEMGTPIAVGGSTNQPTTVDGSTNQPTATSQRRSSRIRQPTREMLQSVSQQDLVFSSRLEVANNPVYADDVSTLGMDDPIAFAASKSDPDTMYYHEAMKQDDAQQFREAMQKEVDDHVKHGHWEMIHVSDIPKGTKVLDSVWAMKRKRRIKTREIYKWKGRLNVHGGQMLHGIHYWETFSPVVTWIVIRMVLVLSLLLNWYTRQIDFVLAYPQAPAEAPTYMKIPRGVKIEGEDKRNFVLKLIQNLYGGKAAGRIWNKYLHAGLIELGFTQSKIDECCYYRNGTIFLVYVDDGILAGPRKEEIDLIIRQLGEKFNLTDEGDITDYLGVNVDHLPDGRIKLSQPHLIDQIVEDVNFKKDTKPKSTPAAPTKILNKDEEGEPHSAEWDYRSVIGKLNFLEKSTRGEIAYAVHQAARFSACPKRSHTDAVHRIVRFLVGTRDEGIILDPNEEVLECYPDADFMGLWDKDRAEHDPSTARSRTGYVVRFCGCPIVWASKLQTEFCLSSTESEYVSLSQALREVLPIMAILEEMKEQGVITKSYIPKVYCKVFEDNSGALEMVRTPKMRPRTKHINVKFHHFRSAVARGAVQIFPIDTLDQLGDLWTKPLGEVLFEKFTLAVFGWSVSEAIATQQASLGRGSVQLSSHPAVSPAGIAMTTSLVDVGSGRRSSRKGGPGFDLGAAMRRQARSVRFRVPKSVVNAGPRRHASLPKSGVKARPRRHASRMKYRSARASGSEWSRRLSCPKQLELSKSSQS